MDTNSKRMLEALPDFNDLSELIERIKELGIEKAGLEAEVKSQESLTFATVMADEAYLVNGKQPSVSHYDNAWKYNGIDGKLGEMRKTLLEKQVEIEYLKSRYDLYKNMMDMFKTLVYQEKTLV